MTKRSFKRTFQNMARGFKQVVGVARRGVKHVSNALKRIDKFADTTTKALDTAGQYAHLAAVDFNSERAGQVGNRLLQRADQMRNGQHNSLLLNRMRKYFGR